MTFAEKLKALMRQRGDTQELLGDALGVAHTSVGRWLDGATPRPSALTMLATRYGVSPADLADDTRQLPRDSDDFIDFVRRTDLLAAELSIRLEDLPARMGVSRASFFGYRAGQRTITGKAWAKLAAMERHTKAGVVETITGYTKPVPIHPTAIHVAEEGCQAEYGENIRPTVLCVSEIKLLWQNLSQKQQAKIAASFIEAMLQEFENGKNP